MRLVVWEQTELRISRISHLWMNQMNQASCSWTNIYTTLVSSASEHSHGKTPVLVHWTSIVHLYRPVRSDIWRMGKAANKLDICSWFILQCRYQQHVIFSKPPVDFDNCCLAPRRTPDHESAVPCHIRSKGNHTRTAACLSGVWEGCLKCKL